MVHPTAHVPAGSNATASSTAPSKSPDRGVHTTSQPPQDRVTLSADAHLAAPSQTAAAPPADDPHLTAARRMVAQGRSFDELPPPMQRALLADQKSRNPAGYERTVQAHAEQPAWERRLAVENPERYRTLKAHQQAADENIAADADEETWRKRASEQEEAARSKALLTQDPADFEKRLARSNPARAAQYHEQQQRALQDIVDDGAPDAIDRADVSTRIRDDERRLLARAKDTWVRSLSPAQRAAWEARQSHDDASIMDSGLKAAQARSTIEDTLTFGAAGAAKRGDAVGTALELATLGSYGLTRAAGQNLGRASAYREQSAQLHAVGRHEDADSFSETASQLNTQGAIDLTLASVGMLAGVGGASRVTSGLLERAGLMGAAETEAGALTRAAVAREAGTLAERGAVQAAEHEAVPSIASGGVQQRWIDGRLWFKEGTNEWTIRTNGAAGLQSESAAKGYRTLALQDARKAPVGIRVHGNPSPAEMARLRTALNKLPPLDRSLIRELYLSEDLGETLSGRIGGLASRDGRIILDRVDLMRRGGIGTLYHEVGHLFDFATAGFPGVRLPVWNGTEKAVSRYAAHNATEKFAETYRYFFEHPTTRVFGPALLQKMEISRLTGVPLISPQAIAVAAGGGLSATVAFGAWLRSR